MWDLLKCKIYLYGIFTAYFHTKRIKWYSRFRISVTDLDQAFILRYVTVRWFNWFNWKTTKVMTRDRGMKYGSFYSRMWWNNTVKRLVPSLKDDTWPLCSSILQLCSGEERIHIYVCCVICTGSPLATIESGKGTHLKGVERIPR